jgi:shikimate kinase
MADAPERPAGDGAAVGTAAGRHVALVGLMGVGKTTVGRRLAKELEWPFADADEQVELRDGRAIPAIFRDVGEEAFRRLESATIADLVARPLPTVIAGGGGLVTRPENRRVLADGATVVWLRASAAFLAARTDPAHRPLLRDDPVGTLTRLMDERTPLYTEVADLVVDIEAFQQHEKPKRAIARHIAALVAPGAVPGADVAAGAGTGERA